MKRWISQLASAWATAPLRLMIWGSNRLMMRSCGQGLVEYGLILVLIMVVCVAILATVGSKVSNVWYTKLINNGAW